MTRNRLSITTHPQIRQIVQATFPTYRGRKLHWTTATRPLDLRSCWDGGSRDYFALYRIADGAVLPLPAQSAFDPQVAGMAGYVVPQGVIVVEHSIFCGKDQGLTFHVNQLLLVLLRLCFPTFSYRLKNIRILHYLPSRVLDPSIGPIHSRQWCSRISCSCC